MYTAGISSGAGDAYRSIGQGINQNVSAWHQLQDQENLRKFYASLAAQQGAPFQTAVGTGEDLPLAQAGGLQAPAMHQQYVRNAGVNELLNRVIGENNSLIGGGGGGGNIGKVAAILKAV
jgi:hypothetical protein